MDFIVSNLGTLVMFNPVTNDAREWVSNNVEVPDYMWMGTSFAVEHRYANDIVKGIYSDGLDISG